MANSLRLLARMFRYPFGSQLAITLGSAAMLVALGNACGGNAPGPPRLAKPDRELLPRHGVILALAFDPSGTWLASGTGDKTARLWDLSQGQVIRTMTGHSGPVTSLAVSADGKTLATGSADRTVKLWDTSNGSVRHTLTGHVASVSSVAFSPDGRWVASASEDKTIRVWDAASGQQVHVLEGNEGRVNGLAFSPDSASLASVGADKKLRLWNPQTGVAVRTLGGSETELVAVAFSPDGKLLATASALHAGLFSVLPGEIRLLDPATGSAQRISPGAGEIRCLTFSPDGEVITAGMYVWGVSEIIDWDVKTREVLSRWHAEHGSLHTLAYRPGGRELASGGDDERIRLWH